MMRRGDELNDRFWSMNLDHDSDNCEKAVLDKEVRKDSYISVLNDRRNPDLLSGAAGIIKGT